MLCLFCSSVDIRKSKIPPNFFNNKVFYFYNCMNCGLTFINPLPNEADLIAMYQPTYQGRIEKELIDVNRKMPGLRFAYKTQFDIIKNYSNPSSKIVDFGCGTGHFVYNALKNGIHFSGVEFNNEVVKLLSKEITQCKFETVSDFLCNEDKYDLIRLSNVLEHFTNPKVEFNRILSKLNTNGIVLVEGPLEKNASLVNYFKWKYFILRLIFNNNYQTNHPPTHIFYSNNKNQLEFFKTLKLETLRYTIVENSWPYPESLKQIKSFGLLLKFIVAFISKLLANFYPGYGNTFLYVGRKI